MATEGVVASLSRREAREGGRILAAGVQASDRLSPRVQASRAVRGDGRPDALESAGARAARGRSMESVPEKTLLSRAGGIGASDRCRMNPGVRALPAPLLSIASVFLLLFAAGGLLSP